MSWDPVNKIWVPAPPAPGSISTGMIAANAVTASHLASGASSNPSTTSAAFVNVPDLSVTFTATVTEDVLVTFVMSVSVSAAGLAQFAVNIDGAGDSGPQVDNPPVAPSVALVTVHYVFLAVAAGAHTISARWTVAGGATLSGFGANRYLTVTELRR